MSIQRLKLQDFLTKHEHSAKHLLSCSDCDGFLMKEVLAMADSECSTLWDNLRLGYTHPLGHPLLRQAIADQYEDVPAESVVVTSSTNEALMVAFQTLLQSGDHVVAPAGFEPHYHIPMALGASVDLWKPKNQENAWVFDVDDLAELITKSTKLLVLCFPHNPTGSIITHEDLQRVCDLAEKNGVTIISDEVFRGVERNPDQKLKSASEISRNAITCSGLSKVYGAAGLRIGWIVVHDTVLRDRMLTQHYYDTGCSSAPSEILALITLRNTKSILAENRRKIESNLDLISSFFHRHSDQFSWSSPLGGTVGLARLNEGEAEQFCKKAVNTASIMIAPSTVFDHGNDHVRIGYGRKNLPEVLKALEEYLSH